MTEPRAEHGDPGRPLDTALARLSALDALLRAEGLAHSPDRWLNLQDLLVRMAREGRLPGEPADLRRHMAPLFCRSPEEQARFREVFDRWLAGVPVQEQEREREVAAPQPVDEEIPHTPYWPFGLAALILIALVWWGLRPPSKSESSYPQEAQVEAPAPSPGPITGDDAWKTLPLQPLPPRTPLEEPVLDARHRAWLAAGDYTAPWIAAVLAVFGLVWRWVRRKVVLRGRRGDPRDPLATIPVAGVDEGLFGSTDVRTALRRLHTPVRWPTRRLAPRPTVERTVRLAGLFTPVYQQRPEVPDLVLLVDFRHRADHMAGLGDLVQERLSEAGLVVHRYDFQGEPRLARGSEAGAWLGLEELAARHPGSRLLVAGAAAALLDAWSGALLPWAETFAAWPDRGLLHTSSPAKAWRDVLEKSGFALAPLSSAGLVSLGSRLTQAPPARAPAPGVGLPDLLADLEPWLSDTPPPAPRPAELLRELRDYLGGPGMLLLAAMAGYPALHWGLTRALDLSLFPGGGGGSSGRERRLLRLAALPWCRVGRMPDWLREILLRGLSPVQTGRVAALYRALFREQSLQGAAGIRLPVALPPPLRTRWQRLLEGLRPRGRRLGRYLRDLLTLAPPESLLEDRIFANLLLGGRRRLLDFPLPRRLVRSLPRLGWAMAVRPLLVAVLFAVVGGWLIQGAWQKWGRSAAGEAVLAAERIEHGAYGVEIIHTPDTTALAQALRETLRRHGFDAAEPLVWPMMPGEQGDVPEGGPGDNSVQYGLDEGIAADYVAGRLMYLTHGLGVELQAGVFEDAPAQFQSAPEGRQLRVWLREPGRTGTQFRDALGAPVGPVGWSEIAAALTPEKEPKQPPDEEQAFPEPEPKGSLTAPLEPDMVELAGGVFEMGCVSGRGCYDDELPVHEVQVKPFAIGRHEVTFDEYDRFAAATGREPPDDRGWGRGRRPVIYVSWEDATAYAEWLSKETGKPYRLPTEAEWEFAARAGTGTPFSTGECIDTEQANYIGTIGWEKCAKTGLYRARTVEAGSLPPNPWGLHEVHGNVWEWVQDCWHDNYEGAPVDSSSWEKGGDCSRRVVRGGSWSNTPVYVRSADRYRYNTELAFSNVGFRLARDI